jgi:hypothetical protein
MAEKRIFDVDEERALHDEAAKAAAKVYCEVERKEYAARYAKFSPELEARLGPGYQEKVNPKEWIPTINEAGAKAEKFALDAYHAEYVKVLAQLRSKK